MTYTVMRAARMSSGSLAREARNAAAVPAKSAWIDAGHADLLLGAPRWRGGLAQGGPGARLKESVTAGNSPWWFTASVVLRRLEVGEGAQAARSVPFVGVHVDALEGLGVLPELGQDLHDHVVLVHLEVQGRRPVAGRRRRTACRRSTRGVSAEPRGRVAVDDDRRSARPWFSWSLDDVAQLGQAVRSLRGGAAPRS